MVARIATLAFWKRQARTWHWMSGAICLVGVLLFSLTGITLNHAHQIPAQPTTDTVTALLPEELLATVAATQSADDRADAPLPELLVDWLRDELGISTGGQAAEWTEFDVYLGLPRPGGDAWLSIDFESGELIYEHTRRGVIAYLNDLHKGRNSGVAWSWFIDIFAVACVLFCLTGLWLLQMQARRKRSTWPLTLLGIAVPVMLVLGFVHQ